MKPIYLEFCGINSFSEKTEIDFRALLSGGVFGIFGDTGSGKSTILDCIHLALYGKIERSSGSECINYGLDSAYVIFDFEITTDGARHAYRVKRERRRKNNISKAQLYEYTADGGLLALAEGTLDVNDALENIIGLTFADFKMCIALPQGDFAALVKAPTGDRVKLVSRLFDLEKYGARLWDAATSKYYRAEEEVNLIKARMEQNEGGGDEIIAQKEAEIVAYKAQLSEGKTALKNAESAYEAAKSLQKEKEEYDRLCESLEKLRLRLPEMEEKRALAERLPAAKAVKREADALRKNERDVQKAKDGANRAQAECKAAEIALEQARKEQTEADYDNKILNASLALEKVRGAEAELKSEKNAYEKYLECKEEYKRLGRENPYVNFAAIRAEKEAALASLGEDGSFLEYLKHNCKDVLLTEAYGEFRADLNALTEKYPQIHEDAEKLIQKYTLSPSEGKTIDIEQLNAAYKRLDSQRKALQNELLNLQKQESAYEISEKKREEISKQGKVYHEIYDDLSKKNALVKDLGTPAELENTLKALQNAKQTAQAKLDRAQETLNGWRAHLETQNALITRYAEEEKALKNALKTALQESGFRAVEEAEGLLEKLGDEAMAKAECKEFFDRFELLKNKYEETDKNKFAAYDPAAVARALEQKNGAAAFCDELTGKLAAAENERARLLAIREKYREFEKELAEKEKERKLCDELRSMLKGNRFLEFIASEYLQDICVSASKTLLSLTSGRYFLKYEKEFKVGDNLDGGNLRAVKTLSGGETFLVSLSLALSLSAAICQKSLRPIEFFFLDEGFGTLDEKLVDTVMDVLGKLSKDFAVGLISHVEELKHRIDNKILVTGATESHGSKVRVERF